MIVGTGIDIVEISRIEKSMEKFGQKFLDKILTKKEMEYCQTMRNPTPTLAGRFAAKEAAVKALGTGIQNGVSWKDIEIENNELGKPVLRFYDKAKEIADKLLAINYFISISHSKENAVAFVILEK
ncbi:MAG: hypothetical protein COA79_05020 [Planctomycetota bacterium]|nr:MAG: hypothetical protein COA79_05020 [Planctomycetota bacterium]